MLETLVRTAAALRHAADAEHVMKARRHTCDRDGEVSRASLCVCPEKLVV